MRLIIIGAGGHGQVVADIASQTVMYNYIEFLDDNSTGPKVIGKCSDYLKFNNDSTVMYTAFGNNEARLEWNNKLIASGMKLATIIHPLAYVSPKAKIDDGCVIMPYAVINTNSIIKKGCIINVHAIVNHDCILEEGCHIGPGAIVKAMNHLPSKLKVDSGEVIPLKQYNE